MRHRVDTLCFPRQRLAVFPCWRTPSTGMLLVVACGMMAAGGCRSTESLARVPGMKWLTKTDPVPAAVAQADPAASLPAPSATVVPQTLSDAAGPPAEHQTVAYESNTAHGSSPSYPSTGYPAISSVAGSTPPRPEPNPSPIQQVSTSNPSSLPAGTMGPYVQQGSYASTLSGSAGPFAESAQATAGPPPTGTTWNAPPASSGFSTATPDTAIQGTVSGPPPAYQSAPPAYQSAPPVYQSAPPSTSSEYEFVPTSPPDLAASAGDVAGFAPPSGSPPPDSMGASVSVSSTAEAAVSPASYARDAASHYASGNAAAGVSRTGPWRPGSTSSYQRP